MKLLAAFLLTAISPVYGDYQALSESEGIKFTQKTLNCIENQSSSGEIWKSFDFSGPTILHFANGHIYAFGISGNNPNWQKMGTKKNPYFFSPTDFLGVGNFPLSFNFPIEDKEAYVVKLDVKGQIDERSFVILVHERFHLYQFQKFKEISPEKYSQHLNIDNQGLIQMENLSLFNYLKDGDLKWLRFFSAINIKRMETLDSSSLKWEELQQRLEGGAEYIQTRTFIHCNRILEGFDPVRFLIDRSEKNLVENLDLVSNSIKWRHYQVGAIIGLALDQINVSNWKRKVQNGKSLSHVLNNSLNLTSEEIDELLEEARLIFDLESILATSKTGINSYEDEIQKTFDEFEMFPGIKISLNLSTHCPSGGYSQDSLYLPSGDLFEIQHTGSISCENQKIIFSDIPFKMHQNGAHVFKISEDSEVYLDGEKKDLKEILTTGSEVNFTKLEILDGYSKIQSDVSNGQIIYENKMLNVSIKN